MNFAKDHLKQLGWQEGDGLGRNRDGITEALKPKLKFDTSGVGHDPAREFTHAWWNEAYNKAADNITVAERANGCRVVSKPKKKKRNKRQSAYGSFVAGGVLDSSEAREDAVDVAEAVDGGGVGGGGGGRVTDDQLLAVCGGRTAHKGARHGHTMDGKLARILAQEEKMAAVWPQQSAATAHAPTEKCDRKCAGMSESQSRSGEGDLSRVISNVKTKRKHQKKRGPCDENEGQVDVSTDDSNLKRKKKQKIAKEDRH